MKNLALPSELMAFINESGKFVFIDDFSGWGEEAQLKNFRFGPAMEGNKLIADTGEEFGFQYVSMRRGNHLTVQLRDHREKSCQQLKLADLPIFREFDVVIWTSGESLQGFAPVCGNKFELAVFLQNLEDYDAPDDYRWSRTKAEMASLAKFLYKEQPQQNQIHSGRFGLKKLLTVFQPGLTAGFFIFKFTLTGCLCCRGGYTG